LGAQVVAHWNQIIVDLKNWAILEQVGGYQIPSATITKSYWNQA